jgi:hypothetical protein
MKLEIVKLTEPFHEIRLIAESAIEIRILELWGEDRSRVFQPHKDGVLNGELVFARTYKE